MVCDKSPSLNFCFILGYPTYQRTTVSGGFLRWGSIDQKRQNQNNKSCKMTCEKCDYREIANSDCEKTFCVVFDHKGFFGIRNFWYAQRLGT